MGATIFTSYQNNDRSFALAPSTFGTVDQDHYTYIGFADSLAGSGFTTTYDDTKLFYAIKISTSPLTPVYTDFTGLWIPFEKHRDDNLATYTNCRIANPGDLLYHNSLGLAQQAVQPIAYYHKGTYNRVYFVIYEGHLDNEGGARAGHNHMIHVMFYDLDLGEFSPPMALPQVYPAGVDYHDIPSIIVSDDGSILVFKETLENAGSSHNTTMEFWKSDAPETIEDPASAGNHYFTQVLLLASGAAGAYAYPSPEKGPNDGEIMLFMRANGGDGQARFVVIKSEDNGSTWANLSGASDVITEIADGRDIMGDANLKWFLYNYPCNGSRDQGYHAFFISNEGTNSLVPATKGPDGQQQGSRGKLLHYVYSADGITWRNDVNYFAGTGGFTKNVVSSGAITPAELLANCVIEDVSSDVNESITVMDQWVDNDGNPSAIVINYNRYTEGTLYPNKANVLNEYYIIRYNRDTSTWVKMEIWQLMKDGLDANGVAVTDIPTWVSRPAMVAYGDGRFDVLFDRLIDEVDPYDVLSVKSNYSLARQIEITDSANLIYDHVYRIAATTTDNFGAGLVVGDYFYYRGVAVCSDEDRLIPIKTETVFWRTTDYGTTWFMVRPPMRMWHDQYGTVNGPIATGSCMYNTGYSFFFRGHPRRLTAAGTALDHSEFAMFIDKIQI